MRPAVADLPADEGFCGACALCWNSSNWKLSEGISGAVEEITTLELN